MPDPVGQGAGSWARATVLPRASSLAGLIVLAVSIAFGGALANLLIASNAPLVIVARSVLGAVVGLAVGLMLLFGWCLIRAPYEQRDVLRQLVGDGGASGESVAALIDWLRATPVPIYDKGRSVSLGEVCQALQQVGLARWVREEWIRGGLNKAIPPVDGEKGLSNADAALVDLAEHEIIEEVRVDQIDQEPIRSSIYPVMNRAVSSAGSEGSRSVDRSYSRFRFTPHGRRVLRLLAKETAEPEGRWGNAPPV